MTKLLLITLKDSPRLRYTLNLVFSRILEVEWELASEGNIPKEQNEKLIWYVPDPPAGSSYIPCEGLLFRSDTNPLLPKIQPGNIPQLFPSESKGALVPFDLLSAVFFMAVEFPQDDQPTKDEHGRYEPLWSTLGRQKIYDQPLVHLWCTMLAEKLGLSPSGRRFNYEITVDVDQPWKYKHKGFAVQLGGLFKDLFKLNFSGLKERLAVIFGGKDPFDTYEEFISLSGTDKIIFFFLIGGNAVHDSRFSIAQQSYQQLISILNEKKNLRIGIHPSYKSSDDPEMLKSEIQSMRKFIPQLHSSRQHFLRYKNPETYRQLIGEGIREEYSNGLIHNSGFRNGICIPFPWFDLKANEETKLMIHPAVAMDRTLLQYLKLNPEKAKAEISRRMLQVKQVNGCFILILHNETLSDSGEWKGWKKIISEVIGSLKQL